MWWQYSKWQPKFGGLQVIKISGINNMIIEIGSREKTVVASIHKDNICLFPNGTKKNILKLSRLIIDLKNKDNFEMRKWNGKNYCNNHALNYIPHDHQEFEEKIELPIEIYQKNILYDWNAEPFLCSQTVDELIKKKWEFPPSTKKYMIETQQTKIVCKNRSTDLNSGNNDNNSNSNNDDDDDDDDDVMINETIGKPISTAEKDLEELNAIVGDINKKDNSSQNCDTQSLNDFFVK